MELDFPPVFNGVDYLASAVDLLTANPVGPRELEYAVLHIHAAAEVLFKARLQQEHWSLVFDDPRRATRRSFESGNFTSCTSSDTVTRFREIAQITLDVDDQNVLKCLGSDRNALHHYGLTHNARAVESRAGQALHFLDRFLGDELLPQMDEEEMRSFPWTLRRKINKGLGSIRAYRTERGKRLRGTLKGVAT
ncbi:hypothetical protein ABZ642_19765 [Streptomyces sp. NPDC007157]|uniref:hypothetical protein n=1 Tax=Streptomyces sp. NPDC007157 TaxID=3154681 RepID=UPI0033E144DC